MATENLQIVRSSGPRNGTLILQLKGSLNIHTVFDFQNALRAETAPAIILDFTGVPYIDSAGLGALVGAHVAANRASRKLAYTGMNTQVMALIEMTHVNQVFPTFASVQEAELAIS
jgi:anti-sigma B factor antagonist